MTRNMILKQHKTKLIRTAMLLVGLFSGSILVSPVVSQSTAPAQSAPAAKTAPTGKPAVVAKPATTSTPFVNRPPRISNREAALLEAVWGIADPAAKAVESGVIIRFNFRVLDPARAKALTDKNFNPVMQCPEKGVSLVIPSLEKVGQLRQAPKTIVAGQSYWMAFSNSGRPVKPGDRVDVVIGNFQARGLIVE